MTINITAKTLSLYILLLGILTAFLVVFYPIFVTRTTTDTASQADLNLASTTAATGKMALNGELVTRRKGFRLVLMYIMLHLVLVSIYIWIVGKMMKHQRNGFWFSVLNFLIEFWQSSKSRLLYIRQARWRVSFAMDTARCHLQIMGIMLLQVSIISSWIPSFRS